MRRIEVLGIVSLIGSGHIGEKLVGCHQTTVHRDGRQEGFERRSGRARGNCHVHLAGLRGEIVPGTGHGHHLARCDTQNNRGSGKSLGGRIGHGTLRVRLDIRIKRGPEVSPWGAQAFYTPHRPVAEKRFFKWTRTSQNPRLRTTGSLILPRIDHSQVAHPCEHIFPPLQRTSQIAVRPKPGGTLDHSRQQSRLADSKIPGLLPEPTIRGGLHAHQIGSKRRTVEILRDDPELVVNTFRLQGTEGLNVLPCQSPRMRGYEARSLHRDRRRSRDPTHGRHVLNAGAQNARKVHPPVFEKTAVLARDQRLHDPVVGGSHVVRTAVHIVGPQRDAQNPPCVVPKNSSAWITLGGVKPRVDQRPGDKHNERR